MADNIWYTAQSPDYSANVDLLYGYTMTADLSRDPYNFKVQTLPAGTSIPLVDYFGKGLITTAGPPATRVGFPNAYNVNDQYAVVTTGTTTRKVPNRIPINASGSTAQYVAAGSVQIVTLMQQGSGTTITATVAADITRMVSSSGVIVLFNIPVTDPQIQTLITALTQANKPMVPSSNYVLPPSLQGISSTSVVALVTQSIAANDVTRMFAQVPLPSTTSADVASQIADVYGPTSNNAIVQAILGAVPDTYKFAVTARAGITIRAKPAPPYNNFSALITMATSNQTLRNIITAAVTSNTVYLYNFNSGYNRNQVMGANGQVAPEGFRAVTDNGSMSGLSQAMYPVVIDNGIGLKYSVNSTNYYLNGQGEIWSNGPSYWVTAGTGQPPLTWLVRTNNTGVYFYIQAAGGDLYLNGMGDQWGSGPTWWVTTDLLNTGRQPVNFIWTTG